MKLDNSFYKKHKKINLNVQHIGPAMLLYTSKLSTSTTIMAKLLLGLFDNLLGSECI